MGMTTTNNTNQKGQNMKPITLLPADTNLPQNFAAKVEHLIGQVAVAPNDACRQAADRYFLCRRPPTEVLMSVELDAPGFTAYQIGSSLLLVDACDGETTFMADVTDHATADELARRYPEAAGLLRRMVDEYV